MNLDKIPQDAVFLLAARETLPAPAHAPPAPPVAISPLCPVQPRPLATFGVTSPLADLPVSEGVLLGEWEFVL